MLLPIIPPLVVAADSTAIEFPTPWVPFLPPPLSFSLTIPSSSTSAISARCHVAPVGALPFDAGVLAFVCSFHMSFSGTKAPFSSKLAALTARSITPLIFSDADVVLSDVLLWLCAQHQYFSLASPLRRDVPEAMFDWSRCFHASRKLASKAKACIPVNPFWSTPALDVPSRHEGALSHDAAGGGERTMSPRLMPVFAFTMKPRIVHLAAHPWPEFGLATCRPTLLPIQHGIGPYSRLYGCDDGVDGLPLPD
ncbi:hypothetical protein CPB85DRAFT_1256679 [Mucidula mucida]|nr:hypothetical protein CPB85DRAFT_1256679 [Mucidula mucida]